MATIIVTGNAVSVTSADNNTYVVVGGGVLDILSGGIVSGTLDSSGQDNISWCRSGSGGNLKAA
jgi:hypothetical protein